jgi:NDP-sugar pyrophosphorylase family protein
VPTATRTELTLVVMAAGMGRRFGGTKQIAPVGPFGESLLEYTLHDAALVGFGRVVFVIRPEIESLFRERIGRRVEAALATRYVFQELHDLPAGFALPTGREKPWGTGHAVLSARHEIQGPFAVVNGDDFYGRGSLRAIADFLRSTRDDSFGRHALVGFPIENTLTEHGCVARGLCAVSSDGTLLGITERTRIRRQDDSAEYAVDASSWQPIARGTAVSMNLWGFLPSMMSELERRFPEFLRAMDDPLQSEYFLPAVVDSLVKAGRATVRVLPTDDRWFGITYREDSGGVSTAIQTLVECGEYPTRLWG